MVDSEPPMVDDDDVIEGADRVRIEVAPSMLEATIQVEAGPALEVAFAETTVEELLAEAGVTFGIDTAVVALAVDALAEDDGSLDPRTVAAAESPSPGRPAVLTPTLELGIQPGRIRDDGTVDFWDRSILKSVLAGTLLATYTFEVAPEDGTGVDGSTLTPPPLDDTALTLGPGAELDEEHRVIAARDGVVKWDGKLGLDVVAYLSHEGDVDFSSGHLRMEGDITVTGSVQQGFAVRATGDIEVKGVVDGGTVIAGGNVRIGGAIIGESALVLANGHLTARRAQNAVVRSRARVELAVDAIDTTTSGTEVSVTGLVRGGHIEAETTVIVKEAGGRAVGAWLSVGSPPEWPDDVARAIARQAVAQRRELKSEGRWSRSGARRRSVSVARADDTIRQAELRARQRAAIKIAHIDVLGTASEGVTLQFGDRRRTLQDPVRRARFRLHPRDEIIIKEDLP